MDSIGLGDLLAVMNQKDNDGYGWGGSWFWVIILFFFFAFFGRGFGGYGDSGALTRAEQRLKMFDEDHAIILREIGKKEKEGYFAKEGKWDYLYDYYMEQKCDLANKVKNFK